MRTRIAGLVLLAGAVTMVMAGCRHCRFCRRCQPAAAVPVYGDSAPAAVPAVPAPPSQNGQRFYEPPKLTAPLPPASQPKSDEWKPAAPAPKERSSRARLMPPPPDSGADKKPSTPQADADAQKQPDKASTEFPADIPRYTLVEEGVATGLEPFPEGIDWLASHGYRTVLYLHSADTDPESARKAFEAKGLKFRSLEVSPQSLTRDLVQEFSRLTQDEASRPLFIYDRDGMLTGTMWYLHFRLTERLSQEEAKKRASRLGLKEDTDDRYTDLWIAINRVLRNT